jgi:hypothetical protein
MSRWVADKVCGGRYESTKNFVRSVVTRTVVAVMGSSMHRC